MGGTVDPITGQVIWEMTVPLADQLVFYDAHPPRCLDGFACAPITLPELLFDGHGEPVNSIFELACACGGKRFTVLGHVENNVIASPIELECADCDATRLVFDARKHGWNGALGLNGHWEVGDQVEELGDVIEAPHHVIVRFEHGSETLGDAEWKDREQDLFNWITVVARDPETGELGIVFDDECA